MESNKSQEPQQDKDKIIGKNIKKYRLLRKITQEDLGKRLEKTTYTIQRYEYGQIPISDSLLNEIADILEVSLYKLIGDFESQAMIDDLIKKMIGLMDYRILEEETEFGYGYEYYIAYEDRVGKINIAELINDIEELIEEKIENAFDEYENADDYTDEELERVKRKQGIYGDEYIEKLTPREQNIWDNYVQNITYEKKHNK
ncbi:helix-turn-helix domain-containing protein [Sebaldella sp. S0638]|uniref:helix-turn-helix domain-containing protein n=1 Tax=Sebaldella sp. S0638 TaxID=2957809 RepID=UPI0020A0E49F|nr:helix-turn-helix transcriptional regulator [Sebaldella sp. S0638]MCP1223888.1 helix-turn-helix domain-containing protein [Sebaldella sp. S0638]